MIRKLIAALFLATLQLELVEETTDMATYAVSIDGIVAYHYTGSKQDLKDGNFAEHDAAFKALKIDVKDKKPKDYKNFKLKYDKKPLIYDAENLGATFNR